MKEPSRLFKIAQPLLRPPAWGDVVVFLGLGTLLYLAIRLGMGAPEVIQGPEINLSPGVLPYYVGLSLGRMFCAYVLSMVFSMVFGYLAAKNQTAEKFLLPLLDVLQSVPLLSFLPVVFLSTAAVLPLHLALELSSIVLIFTSQAWNIAFAWYQSLTTIPRELRLTSTMFRFSTWLRFKTSPSSGTAWPVGPGAGSFSWPRRCSPRESAISGCRGWAPICRKRPIKGTCRPLCMDWELWC